MAKNIKLEAKENSKIIEDIAFEESLTQKHLGKEKKDLLENCGEQINDEGMKEQASYVGHSLKEQAKEIVHIANEESMKLKHQAEETAKILQYNPILSEVIQDPTTKVVVLSSPMLDQSRR